MSDNQEPSSYPPLESSKEPTHQQEAYQVGYGKPPIQHRFRKGASGNRKGRPSNSRSFKTEVLEVLNSKVTIKEGGKSRKITTSAATLQKLRQLALNGNVKAMEKLLMLALQYLTAGDAPQRKAMLQEDEELLKEYRRQIKETSCGDDDA